MATGDQQDVLTRIKSTLPPWFGDSNPVLDGMLNGLAWAGSFIYGLISYTKLQTRIKTATDGWLDMVAADYFGASLLRASNQSDASFRARILINLIRERATRVGLVKVLTDLTGRTPTVFEPLRPLDVGGYGISPTQAYGQVGAYGSMLMPYQALVRAYRPTGTGIPNVAGYGAGPAGYGKSGSQTEYASTSMIQGAVQDSDIYAAVDSVRPVGTILWVNISS